jgi:fluoride exporter
LRAVVARRRVVAGLRSAAGFAAAGFAAGFAAAAAAGVVVGVGAADVAAAAALGFFAAAAGLRVALGFLAAVRVVRVGALAVAALVFAAAAAVFAVAALVFAAAAAGFAAAFAFAAGFRFAAAARFGFVAARFGFAAATLDFAAAGLAAAGFAAAGLAVAVGGAFTGETDDAALLDAAPTSAAAPAAAFAADPTAVLTISATRLASLATSAAASPACLRRLVISFLPLPDCAAVSWWTRFASVSRAVLSFDSSLCSSRTALFESGVTAARASSTRPLTTSAGDLCLFAILRSPVVGPRSPASWSPAVGLGPTSRGQQTYHRNVNDGGKMPLILVGFGGFAGAITRYVVDGFVSDRTGGGFPWGTFLINITGSFVLGLLFALSQERAILPADIRAPVMTGFIGAYTTFSTWMLESWRLVESGAWPSALANLGGSLVLGLVAVFLGMTLGRAI